MVGIKGWGKKRVPLKGNVAFWRNNYVSGFVSISRIGRGAPAWTEGKYMVEINTQRHLDEGTFETKIEALKYAKSYMERHPRG